MKVLHTFHNVFLTEQRANYFPSTGKNPYRDVFRSNSKSPVQMEIRIGCFRSNAKSPIRGETPIRLFRLNSKSPVQREISIRIVLSNNVFNTDGNPYTVEIFSLKLKVSGTGILGYPYRHFCAQLKSHSYRIFWKNPYRDFL